MPNLLLVWALNRQNHDQFIQEALSSTEGELEVTEQVIDSFRSFLTSAGFDISFISGGWSPELVELIYSSSASLPGGTGASGTVQTLIMGAETIYSPFALSSFTDTLLAILRREREAEPSRQATAVIAAKRLYFGVGGSLDDFVDKMRDLGAGVSMVREETEGVRRGVVECVLP
jgi:protein-histidine N-methyltransferase